MSEQEKKQPPWNKPQGEPITPLQVYNSLTRTKIPFVANNGRQVTWYICGPTVYDASHMGHARNYVGFDIIRRILTEYFRYDVTMVMNITDIDDKIIVRSREQGIPFTDLARHWEKEFLDDMQTLKVQPPEVLTRVSEYVPEIITCIEGIIKNGFAYESNGSVYFDTSSFTKGGYHYAKLEPWSVGNAKLNAEGEGSLSVGESDKRSANDFALWKKSKEGEPVWPSPWGEGRPGWHIECSAMASDILGSNIDIHSGGEDLRFPHHDNEIAQSEAFHACPQWINYFIHSGHLHINGCKMSKSLKNFITIKDALAAYDARQIRMLFLLHRYDAIMDYSQDSMSHALITEKLFSEFFHSVNGILRNHQTSHVQHWGQKEKSLNEHLTNTKAEVHKALCDNFNTPQVFQLLSQLVKQTHLYLSQTTEPRAYILRSVATYITNLFKIFGLIDNSEIGYATAESNNELLTPVLNAFSSFRTEVRKAAIAKDASQLLTLSDTLRDDILPPLGVRFVDKNDNTTQWNLDSKDIIMKEVAQKRELEKQKQATRELKLKAQQEKLEKGKVAPEKMFLEQKDKYSQFDEKGLPTHDHEGNPLSKSAVKKVTKDYEQQRKLHDAWLKSVNDNSQK